MKLLIAVMTCHSASSKDAPERARDNHLNRLDFIRKTWGANATCDYRFFMGRGSVRSPYPDEVFLDCGDSYYETAFKVKAICAWALTQGYDALFKCDDDTFVCSERLVCAGFENKEFVGWKIPPSDENHPVTYPWGGPGYFLNTRMMKLAASDPYPTSKPDGDTRDRCNTYEDGWIGRVALDAGINLVHDTRLRCIRYSSAPSFDHGYGIGQNVLKHAPHIDNDCISACELTGELMLEVHSKFNERQI
jgi:hypothetical protein